MRKIITVVFCLLSLVAMIQAENMLSVQEAIALYEDDLQEYNGQKVIEIIKELISRDIDAMDQHGFTPLLHAARYGYTELTDALLTAGADPDIKNTDGRTALQEAHRRKDIKLDEELLSIIILNSEEKNSIVLSVQEAIALYEDDQQEYNGRRIIEIIEELLSRNINAMDRRGLTSLLYSARYGYIELTKSLILAGADLDIKNSDGRTALQEVTLQKNIPLYEEILFGTASNPEKKESKDYSVAEQVLDDVIGIYPKDGFVPDEETAKKIAEAIWTPIYGDQSDNKPFIVSLIDNKTWVVTIPLSRPVTMDGEPIIIHGKSLLLGRLDGGKLPYIEIDKASGTILKMLSLY